MGGSFEDERDMPLNQFGLLDLDLVWDTDQVLYFDGATDISAVANQLKSVLKAELAKLKGE